MHNHAPEEAIESEIWKVVGLGDMLEARKQSAAKAMKGRTSLQGRRKYMKKMRCLHIDITYMHRRRRFAPPPPPHPRLPHVDAIGWRMCSCDIMCPHIHTWS